MLFEDTANHALHRRHNLLFVHERCFNIDLSELRLTIGAQVFIAETLGDLIVTIHACRHKNLFEKLGRLRQGKETVRVSSARDKIVARTFGRCLCQKRSFNINKAVIVEEITHSVRHLRAETQALCHLRAAQIDIAIAQANVFTHRGVLVELERRGSRCVEYFKLFAQHLYRACS